MSTAALELRRPRLGRRARRRGRRLGGKRILSDVALTVAPRRVRRGARPQRRRQVDAAAAILGSSRLAPARSPCSAAHRRRRRNRQIGYLPQRHGFDSSTPDPRRRSRAARPRRDSSWGLPLQSAAHGRQRGTDASGRSAARERGDRDWSARPATPTARSASCPAASSSAADRPGARARPRVADPRRAARQPRPAQPGGGDRARAAHLPDARACGAARRPRREPAARRISTR